MSDAVQYRAMQDLQSTIQGLNLSGLVGSNVAFMKVATDRGRSTAAGTLPAVLIAPLREQMPRGGGTNSQDDITYPFFVGIVAGDNQDQADNYELYLNWRMNIRRAFHAKQLGPLTVENIACWVEPGDAVDQQAFYLNLFSSWLIVQVVCRETRNQG